MIVDYEALISDMGLHLAKIESGLIWLTFGVMAMLLIILYQEHRIRYLMRFLKEDLEKQKEEK